MRNLIMWNLVTLDGYFEGPQSWDLAFLELAWGDELEQFSLDQGEEAGALVFGRTTYEGMAAAWQDADGAIADFMNSVPKIVCSTTLQDPAWNNTTIAREGAAEIARLKQQPGKDIFVFGSANLSATLMEHGLFDEYRLCLVPVFLGAGNTLFKPGGAHGQLDLVSSRPLSSGAVILTYRPAASLAA